jgi:hypothetical protein
MTLLSLYGYCFFYGCMLWRGSHLMGWLIILRNGFFFFFLSELGDINIHFIFIFLISLFYLK